MRIPKKTGLVDTGGRNRTERETQDVKTGEI